MVNNIKPLLEQYEKEYSNDPEYIAEGLALKVTEEMLQIIRNRNKNQTWLAKQMGVSRARVSRILNARPNMTLLTIAQIAIALGVKPEITLAEPELISVSFLSAAQSEAPIKKLDIPEIVDPLSKLNASFEPVIKQQPAYQMVTA